MRYFRLKDCLTTYSYEKIDHEPHVEGEVDLLGGVLVVGNTVLNPLTEKGKG